MLARKKQGWINYYRKPFLIVGIILFLSLWIFTKPLFSFSYEFRGVMEAFGYLFLFAGILGRIFASFTIASHKNDKIVKTELYSVTRHPLYFFSLLIGIGIGLFTGRPELLLLAIIIFLVCFYPMIINEEKYLIEKFGKEYKEYQKKVPRFFPDFSKWQSSEEITINLKLVTKTLLDASLSILIFPAIKIIEYIIFLTK